MRFPAFGRVLVISAFAVAAGSVGAQVTYEPYYFDTLAGISFSIGVANGPGATAQFNLPVSLCVGPAGEIYVADTGNHAIRRIGTDGVVSTYAGTIGVPAVIPNDSTKFNRPTAIACDASGNLYVADGSGTWIRRISPARAVSTVAGVAGSLGNVDGSSTSARFNNIIAIAVGAGGTLYTADYNGHTIRQVSPSGQVTTLAGAGGVAGYVDDVGPAARFSSPTGVVVDAQGNLYVSDLGNRVVRKISAGGAVVTTFAGTAGAGGINDGIGAAARFAAPGGLGIDSSGNLIVTDGGVVVRKISPDQVVSTLGGNYFLKGALSGTGTAATFYTLLGVAVDSQGSLYLGDGTSMTIRKGIPVAITVTSQPQNLTATLGGTVVLSVGATSPAGTSFQWYMGGTAIPGATGSSLVLSNTTAADQSSYFVVVRNAYTSKTSNLVGLTLVSGASGRISNMSVRTSLGSGQTLIVGAVTTGPKRILVRAIGPTLRSLFALGDAITDPAFAVYNAAGSMVDSNDNWSPELGSSFAALGAFPLDAGSRDAAQLRELTGPNTMLVTGTGAGVVLVELYDADAQSTGRLVNVAARNQVGTGANVLIAGFVVDGAVARTLLIRGIGPALRDAFGVSGQLVDPKLELYDITGAKIAENDNWDSSLTSVFSHVGAFSFVAASKDSALLVTLPPGAYTTLLSGIGGTTGDGIVEVYEVQ